MLASDKLFAGSIPEIYDRFLVPLIFKTYALDLAKKVADFEPQAILETAAGTGVLTREISSLLPGHVRIVATDLNQPMLNYAMAQQGDDPRIEWRQANALLLPFADRSFDAAECQFGVETRGVTCFDFIPQGGSLALRHLRPKRKSGVPRLAAYCGQFLSISQVQ